MEKDSVKKETPRKRQSNRKVEILKAVVELLQKSKNRRITTKELAAHLHLSEAALYRHFDSKAQMFDVLISNVETTLLSFINQVEESEASGFTQLYRITTAMLQMCRTQPGLPTLMVGDFLATEDGRLYKHIELVFEKIRGRFKQCLRVAIAQKEAPADYDVNLRADLLFAMILGQWCDFCKSGKVKEEELLNNQVKLILRP